MESLGIHTSTGITQTLMKDTQTIMALTVATEYSLTNASSRMLQQPVPQPVFVLEVSWVGKA